MLQKNNSIYSRGISVDADKIQQYAIEIKIQSRYKECLAKRSFLKNSPFLQSFVKATTSVQNFRLGIRVQIG